MPNFAALHTHSRFISRCLFYFLCCFDSSVQAQTTDHQRKLELSSPDNQLQTTIFTDASGCLRYSIAYNRSPVLQPSTLGITVNHLDFGKGISISLQAPVAANQEYNAATILVTRLKSGNKMLLETRTYNHGFAYRYLVPQKGRSLVQGEAGSWSVPAGSTIWFQDNVFYYEGLHYARSLAQLGTTRMGPPVTFQTPDKIYASITEAALYHYSGMSLQADGNGTLHAAFINDPKGWMASDTIVSPWRITTVSKDLNGLVNADLVSLLNPPPAPELAAASWIQPGRALWSYFEHGNVTTMDLERFYVDKASSLGFEYNLVDAGWESSWRHPMDSLRALVQYGAQRKVGIWVWKAYSSLKVAAIRRQFFAALHAIGVAGVKIDFIDQEGIEQVQFYESALRDAAAAGLMVNFHGANKPTGYNRTWPNELTREAVYGQEWVTFNPQGPANNCILPFTRFLAGPADYTPGVFDSKRAYGTSRTHQLALQIIFNSALSCWPSDPDLYLASAALPLIKSIPTTWDKTLVLPFSRIGELAGFARRKGNQWFIGVINAGGEKQVRIPLSFLEDGQYSGFLVQDDLTHPDQLFANRSAYSKQDTLELTLRPDGGFAAQLQPVAAASDLTVTPDGGYLFAPMQLHATTNTDADIRYTLDGSEPTSTAARYNGPVSISSPCLFKARLFRNGSPLDAFRTAQFLAAPAPELSQPTGIFIGTATISIQPKYEIGEIYYTLDGSEPGPSDSRYLKPLSITESVKLRAKQFFPSGLASLTTGADLTQTDPLPAVKPSQINPGLTAAYYVGDWKMMPDFNGLQPLKRSTVAKPDLKLLNTRKEFYAIRFNGFIRIPKTGVYQFSVLSDDGSQLLIDDQLVVNNDSCHGDLEKSGEIALATGLHAITLCYFQNGSGQSLALSIQEPGQPKKIIPAEYFFHQVKH